jgi:trans-aconitate methyltransferase
MARDHWNHVYNSKAPEAVSWYQPRPALSLALIAASGVRKDAGIIDVGAGASTLVDCLLDQGYSSLAVLDWSGTALAHGRARLGDRAAAVQWHEADVTRFEPPRRYGLWHDRAVFHFLTQESDRRAYIATLKRALEADGHVVIATFAPDGPAKCSGLDVMRHDEAKLRRELGEEFELRETRRETHLTPWQSEQRFVYARFRRHPNPGSGP